MSDHEIVTFQQSQRFRNITGIILSIAIEQEYILPQRSFDSREESCSLAGILEQINDSGCRPGRDHGFQQVKRVITAAVVNQNNLIRARIAVQDAAKLGQHRDHICLLVIEWDYDTIFEVLAG